MPRLFVAVWPPDRVLAALAGLSRPAVPGLRWTGREQWHVTLRFLGPVDDQRPVVDALRSVVARTSMGRAGPGPVEAALGPAVGRFGNRVLHVPVSGLGDLAGRVVEATAGLGRPPEDRDFAGHLTLARVAKGARVDLRPLAGEEVSARWTVDEVCLVESHLASDRFALRGGGAVRVRLAASSVRVAGAVGEEEVDDLRVAVPAGGHQGGPALLLLGVRVGPRLEEDADGLDTAGRGCGVEGLDAHGVAGDRVHVGPPVDEEPDGLRMAEEGGQADRGEAVGRPRVRLLRLPVDQLGESVEAAEAGGVENVEHRAGGE